MTTFFNKTKGKVKLLLLLLGLTLLAFTPILTAKPKQPKKAGYGMAIFPAKNNININEGTVELWCSLDYSYNDNMLKNTSSTS